MAVTVAPHVHGTTKNVSTSGSRWMKMTYLQCYFVTIATILGTGILGLPVTLAHSGIYPFLLSFLTGFFFQTLLVLFFSDLLQRAHAAQLRTAKEGRGAESLPLNDITADELDLDDLEDEQENNGPVLAGHVIIPKEMIPVRPPNLHLLGELFLGCGMRQMFDLLILFHFIAILISYALAGSEAYAEVIGTNYLYVIPVFVWALTFFIVFALQVIQPIVSILTFLKGSLLLATVGVTFLVGAQIHHEVNNDFAYVGAPFLMGTVALGGVINVMPFLYGKISPIQSQVRGFRNAVVGGLVTCTLLNILWCWSVLEIVPQVNTCFMYTVQENNSFHTLQHTIADSQMVCSHNLSLESAGQNGQISTIPLTQIMHQLYPQYNWIAVLIEMFITISITVSYLTVGAALHHTLSGWIDSLWNQDKYSAYTTKMEFADSNFPCCYSRCICRSLLSLTAFTVVFSIAMLNPQGFVSLLEKIASLALNLEAGIFVFVMMLTARNTENRKLRIPLPLPRWVYHLQYTLPLYFGFAVGYDIYISIRDLINTGGLDHDLHKGLHIGGPFTVSNSTENNGLLMPINETLSPVNFTDFLTGDIV